MDHNQMSTGISQELDSSKPSGCVVDETAPNSYQAGFAAAGGGVFATKFDVSGIFIWFWSRSNIPQSILEAQSASLPLDVSDWGPPSGSFPATTCDIRKFFSPQNLVLDITLCGGWAGQPTEYLRTCANSGPTNKCYNDNVVGPGAHYDDAYFEIKYVRAYTMGGGRDVTPAATAAVTIVSPNTTTTHTPIGLALSPRFYTGDAVGLHLGHTNGLGMLALMVGAAVGRALYL
ncbi:hypothetical protein DXG01_012688 [Tephrocybe rancida]|nr:hypothetical protein DXG01_012688 [Tephrocybe rancida]